MNRSPHTQVALRHDLHRHAERSNHEVATAGVIRDWFERHPADEVIDQLGGHGVAFLFDGGEPGPTLLLRCELDALPIRETNDCEHRSVDPDVSHMCGHDGHMAILAGVGAALAERRPARGRVALLFQPAEETGEGGPRVVDDPRLEEFRPDRVFALHNLPGRPLGQVVLRDDTFCLGSVGLVVRLQGRTSHAAYPEDGTAPTWAMAALLARLPALANNPDRTDSNALLTVTHARLGEPSLGIAPGDALLMAVLRAGTDEGLEELMTAAETLVHQQAQQADLRVTLAWQERFPTTRNDPAANRLLERAARAAGQEVEWLAEPMRWSEDFGAFTARYPGALFGLGSGTEQPQLHNPDYDFPDALLPVGTRIFLCLIEEALR